MSLKYSVINMKLIIKIKIRNSPDIKLIEFYKGTEQKSITIGFRKKKQKIKNQFTMLLDKPFWGSQII